MLITDSNGKYINPDQLKLEARVIKVSRFTTVEAFDNVPQIESPEEVKDIVFQVGLNDLRQATPNRTIQENYLSMQLKYQRKYPNARQHIIAIPPLANRHNDLNAHLQKLSKHTGSNFITTKSLLDKNSGKIRRNLMENKGIHYDKYGIKLVTYEIRKSLYSSANRDNPKLNILANMERDATHSNATTTVTTAQSDANPTIAINNATSDIDTANQF